MNKYKKLLKNSGIFAIANLGTKIISIILVPFYTFMLTTEEYGQVDLITTTISLIMPIITLSIFDAVFRFVMDKENKPEEILSSATISTIITFLVLSLFIPLLFIMPLSKINFLICYFILITQALNTLFSNFVRAIGRVKLFAVNGVLNTLTLLISNILLLVYFSMKIDGYLISILVSNLISCLFLVIFGNITQFIRFKYYNKELIIKMLKYSIPLIPNSLMWWIMNVSDRYIITIFCGVAFNGIYAVANKIPSILNILSNIFFQAWQLSAIEEADSKSKSKFYTDVFNIFSITMLLATSFILVFIKGIVKITISPNYFESWKSMPFLLLGVVFASFSAFLGTNYIAGKKTIGIFKTSILGAIINLVFNILTIPNIGINGAAISTMLSFFIIWIIRLVDTRSFVKIDVNYSKLIKTLLIIYIQIYILYIDIKYEMVIQIFMLIIAIYINKNELYSVLNKFKGIIKGFKYRNT